jgi:hypothetical protein
MTTRFVRAVLALAPLLVTGCATLPSGPSTGVMPPAGKPFQLFTQEDQKCRRHAEHSIGASPNDIAAQNFAGSAVAGTAIGAAVGANAAVIGGDAQRRYDIAYEQCMVAHGNRVPVRYSYRPAYYRYPPAYASPPQAAAPSTPPPPPNAPPPTAARPTVPLYPPPDYPPPPPPRSGG